MHVVIDISKWQGVIDWDRVADYREKNGKPFAVMVRAGFGERSVDFKAHRNLSCCKRLQIPVGLYWYAPEPLRTQKQIDRILGKLMDFVNIYQPEYPVALDIEGSQDWDKAAAMSRYYLERCEKLKLYPMLYGSEKVLWPHIEDVPISRWIANYSRKPELACGMWQYTSAGHVPGIQGRVDMSECYVDYKKVIKENGYNGF